jgi:hypothetical protein
MNLKERAHLECALLFLTDVVSLVWVLNKSSVNLTAFKHKKPCNLDKLW